MNKIVALLFTVALMATARAQTPAQFAALQAQVQSLQAQVAALQRSPIQALVPFLTVDPNPKYGVRGPNIVFHDANVHITNGTFNTQLNNGLGNLIIGYDYVDSGHLNGPLFRSGSHNLIIGDWHNWHSTSGIISGTFHEVYGPNSAAIGGVGNRLFGANQVAIGGNDNLLNSQYSVMVGGNNNFEYYSDFSVIVGGKNAGTTGAQPYIGQFGQIRQ